MANLPPVIGIAGKMSAGKDSIADILIGRFHFARRAMADPIRAECAEYLRRGTGPDGAPGDIAEIIESRRWSPSSVDMKPTPPEIRRLLQWHGTDHRRFDDPRYWADRMREMLTVCAGRSVVIPDIRFADEAALVREFGGELWLVSRKRADAVRDPLLHSHLSERFCDDFSDWNLRIANNGTLADLEKTVMGVMKCVTERRRCARESQTHPTEKFGAALGEIDWLREERAIADATGVPA